MTMLDNLVDNTQGILGDVDAFLLQSGEENLQLEAPDEDRGTDSE